MNTISIYGFGSVGQKLAKLFSDAGRTVIICSKDGSSGREEYQTASFAEGAKLADAVALAIPFTAAQELLIKHADELTGTTIIECTNPLNEDWSPLLLGENTSGAEEIANALPNAKVVKAFNTIFADVMPKERHDRAGQAITAFVCGSDDHSKNDVLKLVVDCGFAPVNAGSLKSARYLEAMAHLNIEIAVGQGGSTNAAFLYHQA
ncbi:NADPH-dependent F420 reductase [Pseudoteredinibacter isoporae]|uniref:NADPH-dependent F420 reductase n=1 Tax=Pseudoteredinibacter isoporae TaxID=570281 RepID=UPI003109FE6D